MIIYKQGNVIQALKNGSIDILAHGCNCRKVMGAGIAKYISQEWEIVKLVDRDLPWSANERLGKILEVPIENHKFIINCYTQLNYGRGIQVNYDAIRSCMKELNIKLKQNSSIKIGMPKIGAGLGGGDWKRIEKIINEEIKQDIYVYILK